MNDDRLSRGPARAILAAAALAVAIALAAAVLGGSGGSGGSEAQARAQAQRPNIVMIFSDDQQYQTLRAMPYLRKRDDWVNFGNAMVNTALCCPSRATALTGLTSTNNGIESNSEAAQFKGQSTIADWLSADGYRTGFIGKYFNKFPWDEAEDYIPDGWDYWVSYSGKQGYRDYTLNDNGRLSFRDQPRDYSTDVFTDGAVEFIEASSGSEPFFSFVSYFGPHGPWTPPGRYKDADVPRIPRHDSYLERDVSDKPEWISQLELPNRKKRRELREDRLKHQRAMLAIDDGVRRIFKALEETGELDETIVVYTTDHGISFGDHRYTKKNCLHESCSRVPLLIRVPGLEGRRENALVGNIDLTPTFADYAGIETGRPVDGRSLRPILEQERKRLHKGIYLRRAQGSKPKRYKALRTKRFKYGAYDKTGERELYDLRRDPYELENLLAGPNPPARWVRKGDQLKQRMKRIAKTPPKVR